MPDLLPLRSLLPAAGLLLLLAARSSAQELLVHPDLAVLAEKEWLDLNCDPAPELRQFEVLSPALPAGGQLTMMLSVKARPGTPFVLDVGTNPSQLLAVRVFRYYPGFRYGKTQYDMPIEEVDVPLRGRISEGQACALFFLQTTVPPGTPEQRVKLEPAAWIAQDGAAPGWSRYPIEVRIVADPNARTGGFQRCEVNLPALASALVLSRTQSCRPVSLHCESTRDFSVGSLLAGQFLSEMAEAPESSGCQLQSREIDLVRTIVALRRRNPATQ